MTNKGKFTTIKKETRDKIVAQVLQEIDFARDKKNGKTNSWRTNEELYYGNIKKSDSARSNVDLSRAQEFVHTLLSKIDSPLVFKFMKRKAAQASRVDKLNSLSAWDSNRNYWDLKDIVGKKQMIIYGRSIYSYAASSDNGYKSDLRNIDVYNFLVDPAAGGIDLEKARYCGDYGVVKTRQELKAGVKKGLYLRTEVEELLDTEYGNNTETTREKNDAENRTRDAQHITNDTELKDADKFIFWQWGTTFNGERYYVLITENGGRAVRVVKASELFSSPNWWYWTYAAYPDLTEFWTPSPLDYVREIFMAQAVSINQMLDNAEQINKPQRVVDVSAVQNLAQLKYKRGGIIKAKAGLADKAIKIIETPSINTPIQVFNILESIQQRASGVTDQAKGIADTDGRATIYEGNEANINDRFSSFNKSYSFGYQAFARMWEAGVRDHMVKKTSVEIEGPEGLDLMEVSKRDIFKSTKSDEFGLIVESSNADLRVDADKKRLQAAFLGSLYGNPDVDQKDLITTLGELSGVDKATMKQMLDKSEFGDEYVRSEAARDVEAIIDGEIIKPNRHADTSYAKYIVDYIQDHGENLESDIVSNLLQYMEEIQQMVSQNMARRARQTIAAEGTALAGDPKSKGNGLRAPGPSQPTQDVLQQNVN